MTAKRKNVVVGFLGTVMDGGRTEKRWEKWRPTVGLLSSNNDEVHRIELLLNRPEDMDLAQAVVADLKQVSPATEVRLHQLGIADAWDFAEVYGALADFSAGYDFRDSEDYFVHLSTGTHVAQICLFHLVETRHIPGKLLGSRRNRADVGEAWWGQSDVIDLNLAKYDKLASRFAKAQHVRTDLLKGGINTRNKDFNALIGEIETVSLRSRAPMLLCGPTGAGKSQLASRIAQLKRAQRQVSGDFVEVNCATLRGDAAMSTIFGHKKGAFTGAVSDREGMLRQAHKGVLFLDEIGELGLDEQAMLLRAIEDGRFTPLGSDKDVTSEFQLIAGTNRDLEREVAAGRFRLDLLTRINMWTFVLPGLANRPEDLEPNLDFELDYCSEALNLKVSMNTQARERFLAFAKNHAWAGNFREFHACILRMATLAEGGRILAADVVAEIRRAGGAPKPAAEHDLVAKVLGAEADKLDMPERAALQAVFKVVAQAKNQAVAGRIAFAGSRPEKVNPNDSDRMKKFLARFGLAFDEVKSAVT